MSTQENIKKCHSSLLWIIVVLLGFISIILVFKAGMLAGGAKSHFSSHKTGHYQKNIGGYHMEQKKAGYEAFKSKAEAEGMTAEEYKTYLTEQKNK